MSNAFDDLVRRRKKLEELALLEEKQKRRDELPHKHRHPFYKWQREYLKSQNRTCLLTAANQIGKSTIQIIKAIEWATDKSLWQGLWPTAGEPNLFFYLYPDQGTLNQEFETKWQLYLPMGSQKKSDEYGWELVRDSKGIRGVRFNSGVLILFKLYSQAASRLQASTVYAIFCDEELPAALYPELRARLNSTLGYFSNVFTATLNQEFWRDVMEPATKKEEKLKEASKWQISLFDCREYEDGSPSGWTDEKIQAAIDSCASQEEVDRRVFGRFVKTGGRKFGSFSRNLNVEEPTERTAESYIYAGVDIGSGGESGHPSAIVWVEANPDLTKFRVFRAWRGDKIDTTCGDVLDQFIELSSDLTIVSAAYDWASAEFGNIAQRKNIPFQKAKKDHERGVKTINSLFKLGALVIEGGDSETEKLISELSNLSSTQLKRNAKDDLCDALRFALMEIPINWNDIEGLSSSDKLFKKKKVVKREKTLTELRMQQARTQMRGQTEVDSFVEEVNDWNELYEG